MCTIIIDTLEMDRQVFFGITALINEGVSPYRIWDVVRHKIPGMSEVTMMYNRPTTKDLIEAMEVIAR